MTIAVDERRALVGRFPQPEQRQLVNMFLYAYRDHEVRHGIPTPRMLADYVFGELRARLTQAKQRRNQPDIDKWARWLDTLNDHDDEAIALAAWCIEWEQLPREEKERRKAASAAHHRQGWMATQEPTEKQVAYCRSLGFDGAIDSRQHASAIIDRLTGGRGSR